MTTMKTHKVFRISLFVFIASALVIACGNEEQSEALPPSSVEDIPVRVMSVAQETVSEAVTASGLVASDSEARLSFKTGGVIDRIYVDEGDYVKKGQLLAKLNLTEIQAQVRQAEENVEKAKRDLQRAENLYQDSVATLEQVQNARTQLTVAEEQLEIAEFNLSYSEIRAPMSGKILQKMMNEGELTNSGNPVFMMFSSAPSAWMVQAGVTDRDFVRLRVGDRVSIEFDAYPGQLFAGRVSELPENSDQNSGLYPIEVKFDTQGKKFTYGMFATVRLDALGGGTYLAVPIDAIVEGNGSEAFVFVPDSNRARKIPVRIASIRNDQAMIASGLTEGQQIITDGSAYLTDDVTIKIMDQPTKPKSLK